MRTIITLVCVFTAGLIVPVNRALASDYSGRWAARMDIGGNLFEDAELTELGDPVSGQKMKFDPGFQFDISGGYRFTPWLEVGPELGFTFNFVDEIGGWSYHDTTFGQILMMANVRIEYPPESRVVPFIGAGVGGVASFLTFGDTGYYYEPDGTGSDFSLGFQAFGGLRYRFDNDWSLGVVYRYLATDRQHFDVDWWNGHDFDLAVDGVQMHSICLLFSGRF
jgi:opacity protein-like surface antigen